MSDTPPPSEPDLHAIANQAAEQLAQARNITETIKTEMATTKGVVEEIQRTTTADAATITKTKQEIERLKADTEATATSLQNELNQVKTSIGELESKRASLEGLLTEIEKIKSAAETNNASALSAVNAVTKVKATFDALTIETQAAHDDLVRKKAGVDSQLSEITKAHQGISEIYDTLANDKEGKPPSIKTSINALQKDIRKTFESAESDRATAQKALKELEDRITKEKNELLEKAATEFAEMKGSLSDQILSLLPSAGAAGLASTYYDAKSKYGVTPFHSGSGASFSKGTIFQHMLAHDPTSFVATVFFYLMFLAPITVIIWLFYDLLEQIAARAPGSLSDKYLILRTLIAIPLGTVSLFGYSSLRLYRRLYEEYNYKQRVMELYTSFSKEIEAKGDADQQKALIAIMLKAVADKPAIGMHRYDGISQSGIKIDLNQIFSRLLGTPKT